MNEFKKEPDVVRPVVAISPVEKDMSPPIAPIQIKEHPFFILFLQELRSLFLSLLESKTPCSSSLVAPLKIHLQSLFLLLQILSQENRSHTPEYLKQLSQLWHILGQNCNLIDVLEGEDASFFYKVKNLLLEIGRYRGQEEYHLGYYLQQAGIGKDWIPFPLMHLLQDLYEEHEQNEQSSTLALWLANIKRILPTIRKEPA